MLSSLYGSQKYLMRRKASPFQGGYPLNGFNGFNGFFEDISGSP